MLLKNKIWSQICPSTPTYGGVGLLLIAVPFSLSLSNYVKLHEIDAKQYII